MYSDLIKQNKINTGVAGHDISGEMYFCYSNRIAVKVKTNTRQDESFKNMYLP